LLRRLQAQLQQFSLSELSADWHLRTVRPETQRLKQRPPSSYCTRSRMLWRSPTTDAPRGSAFTPMLPTLNNTTPATSRLGILSIAFSFSGKALPQSAARA
jgi:hypothetical protein